MLTDSNTQQEAGLRSGGPNLFHAKTTGSDTMDQSIESMRLIGYVRVSTDDKDQRPERQVEYLTDWAESLGHEIV